MYFSVFTGVVAAAVLVAAVFAALVVSVELVLLAASVPFAEGLNFEFKSVSLPLDFAVAADSAGFVLVLADGVVSVS